MFDEAFNSLDKKLVIKFRKNIKKKYSSKTIFIISHDLSLKDYCSQIIDLDNLQIIWIIIVIKSYKF